MRSSLFSSNSSKLLPSAVKDKVMFTSAVQLTAAAWFRWGLWWQGLRPGPVGATTVAQQAACGQRGPSANSISVAMTRCLQMYQGLCQNGFAVCSSGLAHGCLEGRCWDLTCLSPACAKAKGLGKHKAGKTPVLPGETSVPSQECRWWDPGELFWVPLFRLILLLSASSLAVPTAFSPEHLSLLG